jgi:chaperonin GroES
MEFKKGNIKMKIRPLGDRVLVEPVEEKEAMVGGIYIPDAAKEKPIKGKVIAVGKKYDDDHKEIAFDVKVGDEVLLPKYGGTEVKVDDKKYQIVREDDLLGVFTK